MAGGEYLEGGQVEVPLFELPADVVARLDDGLKGCLIMEQGPGGAICGGRLGYRPDLQMNEVRTLGEWATSRVARFLEHGPEPDGWKRRGDGGWQLWAQLMELPPLD